MLALCMDCWHEMQSTEKNCPNCGTKIDAESSSYERMLFWALKNARPQHRVKVCQTLGDRGSPAAVSHLVDVVSDFDVMVRVAALHALGKIGDGSAVAAIEKALSSENLAVRIAAHDALKETGITHDRMENRHHAEASRA
jgi:HEAT repeat protein